MSVLVCYLVGYSSLRLLCPLRKSHPKIQQFIYHLFSSNLLKSYIMGKWAIFKKKKLWIIACQLNNTNQLLHTSHDTNSGFFSPRPCKSDLLCLTLVEWAGFLQFCVLVNSFVFKVSVKKKINQLDFHLLLRNSINSTNVMIAFRWSCMQLCGWE